MKKTVFRLNFLTACVSLGIVSQAWAGHTYFGIDYQYYRDFAENKGKFTVGAKNIEVYNKEGKMIGTMMKDVPMPDLSPMVRGGYSTLISEQHLISVAHNVGYDGVDFGMEGGNPDQHRFKYKVVKRYNYKNDSTHRYMTDYQHPRLAKFVTEVAPIEMVSYMNGNTYIDLERYPIRVRAGSGHQYWKDDKNNTKADLAYGGAWLTGGNTFMDGGTGNGYLYLNGRVQTPNKYGPLPIAGAAGDSGSPLFIYDKKQEKWLLNGVLREGHPTAAVGNGYQIARKDYFQEVFDNDMAANFFDTNAEYTFKIGESHNGIVTTIQSSLPVRAKQPPQTVGLYDISKPYDLRGGNKGDESPSYKGPNPWSPALHHGKSIYFGDQGTGILTIENNINQGAGGLYFEGNFVVKGSQNNITWQGAGVSIGQDATVEWKVHNPENDRLSKIGTGTLLVNGKGKNLGSLSAGNGRVILDQQADEAGQKQAFKEVGIVSGRATVQLNSADQVDPNNIYFGFRGGRLDLNGHSLTFKRIQNTDEGAMIVNHNATTESTVTITGSDTINNNTGDLTNKRDIAFNGWFGDKDDTKNTGRLNVNYNPLNKDNHFLLSGGTNLKGNITQEGGTLVFSGRPTPHAYNHLNRPNELGRPQGEVVIDDDWINRTFKAENFQIKGGSAVVSRNVSSIEGNWTVSNNANATFGVVPNQQNTICTRSDWTGLTTCKTVDLTDTKVINSIPTTQINGSIDLTDNAIVNIHGLAKLNGNVTLIDHSQFTLSNNATQIGNIKLSNHANATVDNATLNGNVNLTDSAQFSLKNSHFSHQIQGDKDTTVTLENATWTMPSDATLQNLTLNNSTVTLNSAYSASSNNAPRHRRSLETETTPTSAEHRFNTLTVNGKLSGQGTFQFTSSLFGYKSDKLKLSNDAEGDYTLSVRNTGKEPEALEQLTLVESKDNKPLSDKLKFTLENDHVDAGALRYKLVKNKGEFRLHNPIKEQELRNDLVRAEQAEQTLEAKLAELTDKKQKGEAKVRLRRAVLSDTPSAQSLLNVLEAKQVELTAEKQPSKAKTKKVRSKRALREAFSDTLLDLSQLKVLEVKLEAINAQSQAEKERQAQEEEAKRQHKQKELISRYSNSALSELSATVNSMLSVQDELDRLFVDQAQSAVWTNIAQDKRRYDSDAFRAYQQKTNLRQIGVQKALANGRIGAVFSHSRSDNTFDEQVKNHATLAMMSGFAQYQWGDLQFGVNVGAGISASKMAEEQSRKIHRKAINYGVNASYQFRLGQLGIQPYLGVNRYFIERENYQSEDVKVQTPSLAFNRYNAGIRVDYTFTPTDNISVKPYFFVNYVDVSNANVQTTVNSTMLQQSFGRYWQKEVGLKAEILHFQLSAFISKSQGSQLGKQQNVGVKLGYRW
ncbi:TPA: adhesion and penetration autotransporter Hap [Haemophilus influenzae]|uniref:adhesion and penetration autotransporter Hap n=1 Tax=Haemophilus influenzae TaxID=727 RepID=UPI0006828DD9|nr:adhesion and penetration autotransporter Hap [Haemophilus influenzae]KMZ14477.1 S-adenosylmethionine tRNA ribosyltransferase [Haemophilus influenzae]KMZ16680.1 S-adenosylmethionine tRNA ribosyltransferase [Haemophilus influenzae]MCK9023235.1 adhesion and penetration autotransporter Hap [Haemophilus influenzae]ORJ41393.1 autotransporter outer membrane beta-barrel domain-containing protein [Haemophilus influenzae]PRI75009.1 Adhesion and penetration protein autotransporter precursor [Haemophil